ncbi:uncharacterized protein LOC113302231 [Papaver somniferum]|uniref:uncharacterized protein LOC113302231 n=1 Tax=Papaver somniferum TaxID=3469 RepID=UPI000E6FAF35|nr:uncharacterized protein LOC113302231 [Papaver somniferum]
MENDLLCCQFDNLDFATISQGQSPISLIEIDFLCNTFKGLNLDDGDHNKIQASESEILDGFAHCQASITSKVPSLMSGNFNSSLEINCQARFTLFGKFHSVIPIRSVYLDDDGVSDDLNFKLSDEIDRTLQTSGSDLLPGSFLRSVSSCSFFPISLIQFFCLEGTCLGLSLLVIFLFGGVMHLCISRVAHL